jgi:hypothetical protein
MYILQTFQHTLCNFLFWEILGWTINYLRIGWFSGKSINKQGKISILRSEGLHFFCKFGKIPYNLFWKFLLEKHIFMAIILQLLIINYLLRPLALRQTSLKTSQCVLTPTFPYAFARNCSKISRKEWPVIEEQNLKTCTSYCSKQIYQQCSCKFNLKLRNWNTK